MTNNDELVCNPVLAYADSYRSMANQGSESVPVWGVITDLERNIAPLYAALLAERDADKKVIAEQAKSTAFLKEQLSLLANFNPDWDKLEAAYDSLREHMAALNAAQSRIAELEGANASQDDHINQQQDRIDALEQRNSELGKYAGKLESISIAAEKLVRCKGRYHSEQNYRALAALFGVKTPDLPPLETEARTVSVKLPENIPCPGAPKTIWLQTNGDDSNKSSWPENSNDVSWCGEKMFHNDTLYVRADLAAGIKLEVGE